MHVRVYVTIPVEVEVSDYTPPMAGYISGPPEFCYPPEGSEADYKVFLDDGHDVTDLLTPEDHEAIMDEIDAKYETMLDDYYD